MARRRFSSHLRRRGASGILEEVGLPFLAGIFVGAVVPVAPMVGEFLRQLRELLPPVRPVAKRQPKEKVLTVHPTRARDEDA